MKDKHILLFSLICLGLSFFAMFIYYYPIKDYSRINPYIDYDYMFNNSFNLNQSEKITNLTKNLNFNVNRKIVINPQEVCIFEKNINRCDDINNLKRWTNINYSSSLDYMVIFDQRFNRNEILIINENKEQNPLIMVLNTDENKK